MMIPTGPPKRFAIFCGVFEVGYPQGARFEIPVRASFPQINEVCQIADAGEPGTPLYSRFANLGPSPCPNSETDCGILRYAVENAPTYPETARNRFLVIIYNI